MLIKAIHWLNVNASIEEQSRTQGGGGTEARIGDRTALRNSFIHFLFFSFRFLFILLSVAFICRNQQHTDSLLSHSCPQKLQNAGILLHITYRTWYGLLLS